jgi:general secretion pathway protein F
MPSKLPLPIGVRARLFTQLAALEQAGLPTLQAFALIKLPGAEAQARLRSTAKGLESGLDPATAAARSALIAPIEVRVLHAAWSAGKLAASYQRLGESLTRRAKALATLRSRLAMPLFVVAVMLLIQPLAGLVTGTLSGADYVRQALLPLVALAGLLALCWHLPGWFYRGPDTATRSAIERGLLELPVLGPLLARDHAARFFETLGLLLDAGIPMFEALVLATDTLRNGVLRARYAALLPRLQAGSTLAQALGDLDVAPDPHALEFVRSGEHSGTLAATLLRYGEREAEAVAQTQEQLALWLPRLIYACLLLWAAQGLLRGAAFLPSARGLDG